MSGNSENNVWQADGPWGSSGDKPAGGSARRASSSRASGGAFWESMRERMGGGGSGGSGGGPLWQGMAGRPWLILVLPFLAWMATGFYRVEPDEQGVVLRFGAWVRNTQPGLNYHLPWPFETAYTPKVTVINRIDSGVRSRGAEAPNGESLSETYMLTSDKNILDVTFSVLWTIKPGEVRDFLFNTRDPQDTIRLAAESAVREVIAQAPVTMALTDGREMLNQKAQTLLQGIVDAYRMGIQVVQVKLQDVNPPGPVIDAFRDVQSASADQERLQNQAEAYRRKLLPEVRGQATRIVQEAEAYRQQVVNKAQGDAHRFLAVLKEYRQAPEVTRRRIALETMEDVLRSSGKVIMDSAGQAQNVLPYLPLPGLKPGKATGASGAAAQAAGAPAAPSEPSPAPAEESAS